MRPYINLTCAPGLVASCILGDRGLLLVSKSLHLQELSATIFPARLRVLGGVQVLRRRKIAANQLLSRPNDTLQVCPARAVI